MLFRTVVASLAVLAALSVGALAQDAGPPPAEGVPKARIVWRVANPFRFFADPADTEVHRATWLALDEAARRAPVLSAERALAERHPDGWAATMLAQTCWNAARNRHECPGHADYMHPRRHEVVLSVEGIEEKDVSCSWLVTPHGAVGGSGGGSVSAACGEAVRIVVPYPAGAEVTVAVGGQEVARADVVVSDILIVGVGDSYGSGEGNPDIPVRFSRERAADYGKASKSGSEADLVGYPARIGPWQTIGDRAFIDANARWLDQACHRSLYGHQLRAALQLAVEDPHRAVTFAGYACSGAEITQGLFLRYKGHEWVPNPPELSQISAVAQAQCGQHEARALDLPEAYHMGGRVPELKGGLVLRKCAPANMRRIDVLLVSIGGNDVGFARLVANAILSDGSTLRKLGGWFGEVHGFLEAAKQLDALDDRYRALKRAIHNLLGIPWSEADRIVLVAYPPLSVLDDGRAVCPDGRAGMTVLPDFKLSEEKAIESGVAAQRLDDIMRAAAKLNGWTFVDAHRKRFLGRAICAGYTENALSSADDLRLPRLVNGSWQPYNPADWKAYASRQRWFRTPNDAFMAGNFHVSQSIFQKVLKQQTWQWFQLLLASTYSGAFHPTAEGHAAMADAVVEKVRPVLSKYATRPARRRDASAP